MAVFDGVIPAIVGAANVAAGDFDIERSLRFNSADTAYLNRTPSSAGNRKTWTWSGWVKRSKLGAIQYFFGAVPSSSAYCQFAFNSDDTLRVQFRDLLPRQELKVTTHFGLLTLINLLWKRLTRK